MIRTERHSRGFLFRALLVATTLFVLATQAGATMIDVQCVNTTPGQTVLPAFTGAAVVGAPGDYWNPVSGVWGTFTHAYFGLPLKDVAGNSTPVTVNFFFKGFYGKALGEPPWPFAGTAFDALMSQYAFGQTDNQLAIRFMNLAPGPYDLYFYSSPSPDATIRVTQFTAATATQTLIATAGPYGASTFQEGVNYVHLQPLIGSDGELRVLMQGIGNETQNLPEADLSGLQLATAPEPQGFWIVSAPILGFLLERRRKPQQ